MPAKKSGRAGHHPPVRSESGAPAKSNEAIAGPLVLVEGTAKETSSTREDSPMTSAYALRTPPQASQQQMEGVTVMGEAVRRVPSESAEFMIEVTSSAPTATQALRENQSKTQQVAQAISPAGVQPADVEAISMNVRNIYAPLMPSFPGYAGLPQIGYANPQPETQFGSYVASKTLRVNVREPNRVGDAADAAARAGATILGGFRMRATDEPAARRSALEAAGQDARKKAEVLAAATGRQIGDAIAITEDIVASNGMYSALRAAMPFAFGAGAPEQVGELEYYARVSVNFRLT
jgi:uncharacterized protein YggE